MDFKPTLVWLDPVATLMSGPGRADKPHSADCALFGPQNAAHFMTLVPSLLQAIVLMDGEALVLHVGDKPYVVAESGQVSLTNQPLNAGTVSEIIAELLPAESMRALEELGATQCVLPDHPLFPDERFSVVAARGGDGLWLEIRRLDTSARRAATAGPGTLAAPPQSASWAAPIQVSVPALVQQDAQAEPSVSPVAAPVQSAPSNPAAAPWVDVEISAQPVEVPVHAEASVPPVEVPVHAEASALRVERLIQVEPSAPPVEWRAHAETLVRSVDRPTQTQAPRGRIVEPAPQAPSSQLGVVLPLARTMVISSIPPPLAEAALSGLDRLLRLAAARGASTLYLVSGARPAIRIDGDVQTLDGTAVLSPNDVESLLLTLMPERSAEALRSGAASEWISEFDDLGRVRCLSFRDHCGPGGVFRIMPQRAVTTEQLGLSRDIQALTGENEGLLVVTGPRLSGKRTLMSAFVDHINRTRHVHIITVERDINIVHERSGSLVSQREVHGGEQMVDVVRSALREDPDVLVLEDVRSAELVDLALDAAAAGRLVICGFPARSTAAAIDAIIDLSPPSGRRRVQLSLAQNLLGVVAQVLLKKSGGGRLAARELLLNTPAVAGLLTEGKTSQLLLAIEGGRKHGMVPLNDALGGFAQSGAVDVREAYRCSADRPGLLALLQRQGLDVSGVERTG